MKKTTVGLLLVFAALAVKANDAYIYWLQDSATYEGETKQDITAKVVAMKGSTWVYGGGDYLTIHAAGEGGAPGAAIGDTVSVDLSSDGDNPPRYWNIASTLGTSGVTYFIELYNEGGIFARSDGLAYDNATAYLYTTDMGFDPPKKSFTVETFHAASVPEPTSGLLLIFGGALLALRRRRT